MIKITGIDHVDDLGDVLVARFSVSNIAGEYISKAKTYDGKEFSMSCFGVEVTYCVESNSVKSATLYYVLNNGNHIEFETLHNDNGVMEQITALKDEMIQLAC